ncbi:MAG: cation:proton antiporter [Alphaproteobacteria bacterium]|nr:cation:proton antiporter [Alphaproteobacteria bacterium]
MHGLHPLISDLTLITVYAAITTLVFKKLRQPIVLGYLLAGIFAGPHLNFLPTVTETTSLNLWADIGVIFLLFSLGLEFSFTKMVSVGKSALLTALLNIFLLLFFGYYVGLFLGWSTIDSFFLGSMISMSSTTIIIKAFDDLKIKKQKFTDLVFGVLVIEDIMGILLLVLLPTIALGKGIDGEELGLSAIKLFAFLILCFVVGIYIIPTLLKRLSDFLNDEMLLLLTVALSLSMVCLAVYSGFSSALGAFIMGSILSETGVIERIETVIKPLKDFFGAVFFVSVGMMVNPKMFVIYAYPIFIITLVVLIGKAVLSVFGFAVSGQNLKTSVQGGFSLAQVGEFAFIIAALGLSLKVLDSFVYPIIVAVSVITTFLTPIMIGSAARVYKIVDKIMPEKWRAYIAQTATSAPASPTEERLWKALFTGYFTRIFVFSLILSALVAFFSQILRPWLMPYLPAIFLRIFLTVLLLTAMAPFLKGLLGFNITLKHFATHQKPKQRSKTPFLSNDKISKIYTLLWHTKPSNRLPLLILTSFRILLMMFFVITAIHQFLSENTKVTFVFFVVSLLIISQSQWLLNQYLKIETQFLNNLSGNTPLEAHFKEKKDGQTNRNAGDFG